MLQTIALCDSSAYGHNFRTEYESGKHLGSNTKHLAELKSVVRYRFSTITRWGMFGQICT